RTWKLIRPTIVKILWNESVARRDWHDTFWYVHQFIIWNCDGLHTLIKALEDEVAKYVREAYERISYETNETMFIRKYIEEYEKFSRQCIYLPKPFRLLAQHFSKDSCVKDTSNRMNVNVPEENDTTAIRNSFLLIWEKHCFHRLSTQLYNGLKKIMNELHNGKREHIQLLIDLRVSYDNLIDVNVYEEYFVLPYLETLETKVELNSNNFINRHSNIDYIDYCNEELSNELSLALRIQSTKSNQSLLVDRLGRTLHKILLFDHLDIFKKEFLGLLKRNDRKRLTIIYDLMERIQSINLFERSFGNLIRIDGEEKINELKSSIQMDGIIFVNCLNNIYEYYTNIINQSFNNDSIFLTQRDMNIRNVINSNYKFLQRNDGESRSPELLANFCDIYLRYTNISMKCTANEIQKELEKIILLLKYTINRDRFMRYYKAALMRRLILSTSYDMDNESLFIKSMEEVGMPTEFISDLQQMLQDIELSETTNERIKSTIQLKSNFLNNVSVKMLKITAWEKRTSRELSQVILPVQFEKTISQIEGEYLKLHCGRRLIWTHYMSTGTIRYRYSKRQTCILQLSMFQMSILYMWMKNRNLVFTLSHLLEERQMIKSELKQTLHSLIHHNLIKCSDEQSFNDWNLQTTFYLNKQFQPLRNGRIIHKLN
ncbi:hypothetical protein SNEBB_007705, partial [Seison nebaliae]